jgi:hypothetical protein
MSLAFISLGLTEATVRWLSILPADRLIDSWRISTRPCLATAIARASELLQAQLRQPLGAPPLQAQLANDIQFKNAFFGPATVGLNEFNPLFIQDGLDLQLFGLLGDDNTYGDQAILNGLRGPVSFSLSQFMAHTDGYRPNNDDTQRQYDAFVQGEFGASTSAQVEVSRSERESGDLQNVFFSDSHQRSPPQRHGRRHSKVRLATGYQCILRRAGIHYSAGTGCVG